MDIADWRKKIDELDRRLVELLSERAQAAVEIGRLKRDTSLPIYEPERERIVFENVQRINRGPLPGRDLVRIFERIMDVMRNIQKEGIGVKAEGAKAGETELDSDVNDSRRHPCGGRDSRFLALLGMTRAFKKPKAESFL